MQVQRVHSSCELKRLVVVVKVVLELGGEEDCGEEHLVGVEAVEAEFGLPHVVAVDVDDGDDQALGRELGVLVESAEEVVERDGGRGGGVEDGFAGTALLLDQVLQQVGRQQHQFLQTHIHTKRLLQ